MVRALITFLIVLACTLRLTGCVPAFLGGKDSSKKSDKKTERAELLKPQVTEASESPTAKVAGDQPSPNPAAEADSASRPGGAMEESRPSTREARAGTPGTSTPPDQATGDSRGASGRQEKKEPPPPAPPESSEKKGKSESDDSSKDATKTDNEELFKKHDHEKYLASVRNKAIDQVNKDGKCDYARLCRNSLTDEKSLTLYYLDGKTFSFVTYEWDEIDEKWKKDYTSNKWPMSQWEEHLKLAAARQDCSVIKGSGRQIGAGR